MPAIAASPVHDTATPRAVNQKLVLMLVCVAQFVLLIDDTIVNVALPHIGKSLDFSTGGLTWVTNAYFLTFGGFLLLGGRLADRLGRRRLFSIALIGFIAASALCGAAPNAEVLIGARAVQGISAALLSPAALAILLAVFRNPAERAKALGVWAALTGIGAATGLLLGGTLVEYINWRWIFLINLPIGLLALVAIPKIIPADVPDVRGSSPDLPGAFLGTASVLLLVYTVVETHTHGWTETRTVLGLIGAAVLAAGFALRQRLAADPLIPRALLRMRTILASQLMVFLAASGLFAMFFFMTLYMQDIQHWGPMRTGLSFLPFSFGMAIGAGVASKYLEKQSPLVPLAGGPAVAAIGMWLLSRLHTDSGFWTSLAPALAVTGLGLGFAFVALMQVATGGVGEADGGLASAMVTTCQQIGAAVSIAVLVTIATGRTEDLAKSGTNPADATVEGFSRAFEIQTILMLVVAVIGAAVGLAVQRRTTSRSSTPRRTPPC